ncbi:Acetylcholinesterase, partial [Cryptotermes secundus]
HNDPLVIETQSGMVRGFSRIVMNKEVHIFTGIPFAKPPVGPLRFRRPVPVDPWHGVLDATTLPNSCYQERYEYFPGFEGEEMWNPNTNVSEDCLYLSIWVPQRVRIRHSDQSPKVPILVWIYGGGYMSGTSTLDVYDADIVAATSDVIVASMQYRVGSFGFLYLTPFFGPESEEAPGNMGLWDQALAIRWLRDNAGAFGGDPDLITLFGESAGGGSVSLHLLSPVTRGLVRRGIMQSGTLNAPWSYMDGEKAADIGRVLVEDVGCNSTQLTDSPSRVMACLRLVDSKTISVQQWNSYWGILGFPSAPTIDGVFLPKHPLDLIRDGNYEDTEILIGSNQDEVQRENFIFSRSLLGLVANNSKYISPESVNLFKNFIQLKINATRGENEADVLSRVLQYTDWEHLGDGYINQKKIAEIVGDYFFICPTNLFAEKFAEQGTTVYYYYFTQRTSSNLWGKWMGVMHGDEIEYVFGHPLNMSIEFNHKERELSRRIMDIFARFALTGKPMQNDTEWPTYTKEHPKYYILNAEKTGTGKGPRTTACAFWNDFLPRLKNHPGEF